MKILSVILIFLLFPLASAISIDLQESYAQRETIIAEISGNILSEILSEQVELRRGHVRVPFEYDIKKLGNKYFLYGFAPASENNYTLIIKDVETTINGNRAILDLTHNFHTISETIIYNLRPGFAIINDQGNLGLTINLYKDFDEIIETGLPGNEQLILKPGENRFDFPTNEISAGFSRIQIGIYSLPIYINKNSDIPGQNNVSPREEHQFRAYPDFIEGTVLIGSSHNYPFRILNTGEREINNLEFIYDEDLFEITPSSEGPLFPENYLEFTLNIISYEEEIEEVIIVRVENKEIEIPIRIIFTEDESQVINPPYLNNYQNNSNFLCSELEGVFCTSQETCSGNSVPSLDGNNCCLGICQSNESENNLAWIGWLIGAIILIAIVIIAGRYFKTKKLNSTNPLDKKIKLNLKP